jgi:hypothetical protein
LESDAEPHCIAPACRAPWNLDFLADNFTGAFVHTRLRDHHRHQLFDKELSLMPATQPLVQAKIQEQQHEALINQQIERKKQLDVELRGIGDQLHVLRLAKIRMQNAATHNGCGDTRNAFVRACPAQECRGFLSTAWKCGVCQIFACSHCHEVKGFERDAPHTCNPDNVETAKLIAKDSKPCPQCGAVSIRVEGCAQVYCVSCHTAWNWNTRKIETGPIHAVDYYTYLKRNGGQIPRAHGDVPCGGMPDAYEFQRNFQEKRLTAANFEGYNLLRFIQSLNHLYQVDGGRMRPDRVNDNADLRVSYLLKEIDQKRFMQQLQQREKARLKNRDAYQVIQTIYEVASEILRRMQNEPKRELIDELHTLLSYGTDGYKRVVKTYNCITPNIPQPSRIMKTPKHET